MSIAEIKHKITPILEEYHVGYAGIFGSVARGEDHVGSDVDILVSMETPIGIYKFMELQERLESAVGRDVDLVSQNAVHKYLAPHIARDLVDIYGKG